MFGLDISNIINFFLGMMTGMVLFSALYVYFFVRGQNINVEDIVRPEIDVEEDHLKNLILDKQKKFKIKRKIPGIKSGKLTFELSYELLEEISTYFFPDSKYPMLELSVYEIITLNHYITDRIDKLLEKPLLKNTKNVRIVKFVQYYEKKKQIEESKIVKAAKKYKVNKVLKYAGAALNVVNPVYWFRKLVINKSMDAISKKISLVIIGIVGEETTKVYSKKLFDEEMNLNIVDDDLEAFLESPDEEDEEELIEDNKD